MFSAFTDNPILLETLTDYIDRKITLSDGQQYAYTVVSKKNPLHTLIISSYPPEWVELYRINNFQLTDPVILKSFRQSMPFSWDENISLMSDLKLGKIFSLSRQYNISNGFTFILHDHYNNFCMLSITADKNIRGTEKDKLVVNYGVMQILLIDINSQMYKLVDSTLSGSRYNKFNLNNPIFTMRENDVLYWASMGKTYAEIASIIGITVSTVKFHMGNAVGKLRVANARQAIRLGIELDLIKPAASAVR